MVGFVIFFVTLQYVFKYLTNRYIKILDGISTMQQSFMNVYRYFMLLIFVYRIFRCIHEIYT